MDKTYNKNFDRNKKDVISIIISKAKEHCGLDKKKSIDYLLNFYKKKQNSFKKSFDDLMVDELSKSNSIDYKIFSEKKEISKRIVDILDKGSSLSVDKPKISKDFLKSIKKREFNYEKKAKGKTERKTDRLIKRAINENVRG